MWHDMLHPGIPVLEKIIRSIIVYFALLIGLRLAGKREMGQFNPFDLVVLLLLSNTVQNAIIGDDNSVTGGLLGAIVLLITNYVMVRFFYTHHKLEEVLEGEATVLIENGEIVLHACEKELITIAELEVQARKQGIQTLEEVLTARLEPGGSLTFVAKTPTVEEERHLELVERLRALESRLDQALVGRPG
jgi:uncharacterized membrane protein YcaP (DUF421 family)